MSRYSPNIEIQRKCAGRWLACKGWEPYQDPRFPFKPCDWKDPQNGAVKSIEAAVELQIIRETNR